MALNDQMSMFEEEDNMGLMQEGGGTDPVSGNEIPLGGTQEGVRDDQQVNVSPGEMFFSEAETRYFGVEKLMAMKDEAKMGYKKMEAMGQLGNPDEASIPNDAMFNPGGMPFSVVDMEYIEDDMPQEQPSAQYGGMPMQQGVPQYQTGGIVNPSTQQTIPNTSFLPNPQTQFINTLDPVTGQPQTTAQPTLAPANVAQITTPTTAGSTLAGVNPAQPTTNLTVPGTTAPGALPTLPSFGTASAGTTSFNFFRNAEGRVIQIPVLNGRQTFEAPEGFQRFDPDNPNATPFEPDTRADATPDRRAEEREERREELEGGDPSDAGTDDPNFAGEFSNLSDFFSAVTGRGRGDFSLGRGFAESPEAAAEAAAEEAEEAAEAQAQENPGFIGAPTAVDDLSVAQAQETGSSVSPDASGDTSGTGTSTGPSGVAGDPTGELGGIGDQGDTSGDADGNGNGPGGTHVCTATYNAGLITTSHFNSLKKYGIGLRRNDPYLMKGYDIVVPKWTKLVGKNKPITYFAKFLTGYYNSIENKKELNYKQKLFRISSKYSIRPLFRSIGWISNLIK